MENPVRDGRRAAARTAALAMGLAIGLSGVAAASAASPPAGSPPAASPGASVTCVSKIRANNDLADRIARGIDHALSGRQSEVGLDITDNKTRITCWYHSSWHFISASVVKATILGGLLRTLMAEHRAMSAQQRQLTWLMITQSNNNAASALWAQVGRARLQRFLRLAGMRQTILGPGGFWGLTELTAGDEVKLLNLFTQPNRVLNQRARIYARYLMSRVIPSQRWGVPAGAPSRVRVHVKNGWLPYPSAGDWRINSIGAFTTPKRIYLMAILTANNPSMAYGIATIEGAAQVVHRSLMPGQRDSVPRSKPGPGWGRPDEPIPPVPAGWPTTGTLAPAA